ncbi:MAG: hypothetical protein WC623_13465 [Pedobacter sp.]|uniref:hypothetical protein n=1 Tax=Pedobacter sp. TaxID=1411316 RepID=UPI00356623E5
MRLNKTYLNTIKWRPIIGIIAIFCVILSSCAIKSSIKSQLGVQHTAAQKNGLNNQGKSFISSSATDCLYAADAKVFNIQKPDIKLSGASIAILAFCTFSFLFGFHLLQKQNKHPFYNSGQISGSLPIFLQYRKLII